jgi:hypothetical protein
MTEISHPTVPAGWYPDPRGLPQRRWWDGSSWTHALESPPTPAATPAAPAYASMPGPTVRRVPSPNAPTVLHAIKAEASATDSFPTRRQLRDAAAVLELQKQLSEPQARDAAGSDTGAPSYAMGPAVSATQKPQASFSIEQFRTVATQSPTENVTKEAAELTKSPAISTAASLTEAPARAVAQTLPPVTAATPASAFAQTHTFTPAAAPANPVAAQANPVAAQASPVAAPANPVAAQTSPVAAPANPVAAPVRAPATPVTSATSVMPRQEPVVTDSAAASAFVPVMRTGAATPPATIPDDIEYRPFGMTPRITTGTVEPPTHVNTGSVWMLTLMPSFLLGVVVALSILAPEFYTPFILGGLVFVFAMASLALAISDRRQLVQRDHQTTASPAWTLLTPLAYLVARAVRTRQQAGRGWAPTVVFLLLNAAGAAAVVLTAISLTGFAAAL